MSVAHDTRSFALLCATAAAGLALVASVVIALHRLDASGHIVGLLQSACTSIAHVSTDLASLTLMALSASVVGIGTVVLAASTHRTHLTVDGVASKSVTAPDHVSRTARALGVAGKVQVVQYPGRLVFVHGYLRPRIVVSASAAAALSPPEMRAVLAHERRHVQRLDPLRRLFADVAVRSLYFIPLLADLRHHFVLAAEVEADRSAIDATSRGTVASAILKFADAPRLAHLPAIHSELDDDVRIRYLIDPASNHMPAMLSLRRVASTGASVAAIGALVAIVAVVAPM